MKQTILLTLTFLALSCSTPVGAVLDNVTDGIPESPSSLTAADIVRPADADGATIGNDTKAADPVYSDGEDTIVQSPTPNPEMATTKRAEFAQLCVATFFAGKDAAIETFTIENAKWFAAFVKAYILLFRNLMLQFATVFSESMNNLRAANTPPNA